MEVKEFKGVAEKYVMPERQFEVGTVVVNRKTNLLYTVTRVIPTNGGVVYEGKLLGTEELNLLYPEDIEVYLFHKPKAIKGVTHIGEIVPSIGGLEFQFKHLLKSKKGDFISDVAIDAYPFLDYTGLVYRDVAGKKIKITVSIEEID